ncbi:MAG: hypothetical protein CMJ85_09610 [Planctomycetes bacterium]|jgi:hypothetical protein|nr:hypothetical protein [Planctomycetota bacterium]
MKVCVAPTYLLWNATIGGHAWVLLNWVLGLQDLGCEVVLLDDYRRDHDADEVVTELDQFAERMRALGLDAPVALDLNPAQARKLAYATGEIEERSIPFEQAAEECDLLLALQYGLPQATIDRFRRSALLDIDPGLLQMWVAGGHFELPRFDTYFSIGETVGQPAALFSDCGREWNYAPPVVHLPSWPVTPAAPNASYTTVTNWWGEFEVDGGETFNNEKRTHFVEMIDIPSMTSVPIELAIYHEDGHASDMPMLHANGWGARPAYEVASTPADYRRYVQSSRGEFSCAKESCMRLQNAWISDRTLCYLASGKPAVVQHTGPSRFLPDAAGLFRFHTAAEAARLLDAAEADYAGHCAMARTLVEDHFDACKVGARLLERAMDVKEAG